MPIIHLVVAGAAHLLRMRLRIDTLDTNMLDIRSPARLNVLVGAVQVTVMSANPA